MRVLLNVCKLHYGPFGPDQVLDSRYTEVCTSFLIFGLKLKVLKCKVAKKVLIKKLTPESREDFDD